MMRRVVERIGRHLVRLECAHVVELLAGDPHAIGWALWCERCSPAVENPGDDGERTP